MRKTPLKSLHQTESYAADGHAFSVRLRFKGWNSKRNCRSDCWWRLEYDGKGEARCTWGKTGSRGNFSKPKLMGLWVGLDKAREKVGNGYVLQSDSWGADPAPPAPPAPHPLAGLPAPFCNIRSVRAAVGVWEALDGAGNVVMKLTAESAADLTVKLAAA